MTSEGPGFFKGWFAGFCFGLIIMWLVMFIYENSTWNNLVVKHRAGHYAILNPDSGVSVLLWNDEEPKKDTK